MASRYKFYLSSHNVTHGHAGKHGYHSLNDAIRAFNEVRRIKLKSMYYTIEKPNETIMMDSRLVD